MRNFLKKTPTIDIFLPLHIHKSSLIYKFLYPFTQTFVVFALIAGAFLLVSDLFISHLSHMPLSAAPLLLIGVAYLAFQVLIRAQLLDFFKALIVSSAFILWGIDQLLPSGGFATTLGDIVIVLYVIDLGWMMMDRLKRQGRHSQLEKLAYKETLSSSELDKTMPFLLIHHNPSTDQQYLPQRFVNLSKGNPPFLKRNRLTPLPCTCSSPLAPLHSSECCCAMKEASEQ
jgi:hypothetical protein